MIYPGNFIEIFLGIPSTYSTYSVGIKGRIGYNCISFRCRSEGDQTNVYHFLDFTT